MADGVLLSEVGADPELAEAIRRVSKFSKGGDMDDHEVEFYYLNPGRSESEADIFDVLGGSGVKDVVATYDPLSGEVAIEVPKRTMASLPDELKVEAMLDVISKKGSGAAQVVHLNVEGLTQAIGARAADEMRSHPVARKLLDMGYEPQEFSENFGHSIKWEKAK